jgi:hypothetical protein
MKFESYGLLLVAAGGLQDEAQIEKRMSAARAKHKFAELYGVWWNVPLQSGRACAIVQRG